MGLVRPPLPTCLLLCRMVFTLVLMASVLLWAQEVQGGRKKELQAPSSGIQLDLNGLPATLARAATEAGPYAERVRRRGRGPDKQPRKRRGNANATPRDEVVEAATNLERGPTNTEEPVPRRSERKRRTRQQELEFEYGSEAAYELEDLNTGIASDLHSASSDNADAGVVLPRKVRSVVDRWEAMGRIPAAHGAPAASHSAPTCPSQVAPLDGLAPPASPAPIDILNDPSVAPSRWSITITAKGQHVPGGWLNQFRMWLRKHDSKGLGSLEKGARNDKLHIQACVQLRVALSTTDKAAVARIVKLIKEQLRAAMHIMTGDGVTMVVKPFEEGQEWPYMIGYCLKDYGQAHFRYVSHLVDEDEARAGREAYQMVAIDYTTNKRVLSKSGYAKVAFGFHQVNFAPAFVPLDTTLMCMIQSGEYVPSATWVTPTAGHACTDQQLSAFWKMLHRPTDVDRATVRVLFMGDTSAASFSSQKDRQLADSWRALPSLEAVKGVAQAAREALQANPKWDPTTRSATAVADAFLLDNFPNFVETAYERLGERAMGIPHLNADPTHLGDGTVSTRADLGRQLFEEGRSIVRAMRCRRPLLAGTLLDEGGSMHPPQSPPCPMFGGTGVAPDRPVLGDAGPSTFILGDLCPDFLCIDGHRATFFDDTQRAHAFAAVMDAGFLVHEACAMVGCTSDEALVRKYVAEHLQDMPHKPLAVTL